MKTIVELERDDWGNTVKEHQRTEAGMLGREAFATVEMQERVTVIAERLREQDINVSEQAMRQMVRRLKSNDRLQSYNRHIDARAVKLGIRFADRL